MVSCALACLLLAACQRGNTRPPLVAQTSGTIAVVGLSAPVRIVRDRWGVPHVYAASQDDLFFAQGFVQAEDRLFQMDLWRRAAQGRLSEVLGANFIERDAMTRRIQYRGDPDVEWASYGPDARSIASAFVRGVNAWVALARERPADEFVLAGWKPEFWTATDLIDRTDAFLAGAARHEVPGAHESDVIDEALRRIGTRPFFVGFAAPATALPPSRFALWWTGRATAGKPHAPDLPDPPDRRGAHFVSLPHPSPRYLVHLNAPGWNVIGATAPWRPGVVVGHNERIGWSLELVDADAYSVSVGHVNPANPHQVEDHGQWVDTKIVTDAIVVKRRARPFVYESEYTPRGVIVASDRERHLAYVLRWSGAEPGASELAALALNRAQSSTELVEHLGRWKLPVATFAYFDVNGSGSRTAGSVPLWRESSVPSGVPPSGRVAFSHPLAIDADSRQRFNVGPFVLTQPRPAFEMTFDAASWDRSSAMNAPGQSESPDSDHFADLAKRWAEGGAIPLWFTERAVQANASATLTLEPRRP